MPVQPNEARVWTVGGVPQPEVEPEPETRRPARLSRLALVAVTVVSAGWVVFGGVLTVALDRPETAVSRTVGTVVEVHRLADPPVTRARVRFRTGDGRTVEFDHQVPGSVVLRVGQQVSVVYRPDAADPAAGAYVPSGAPGVGRRLIGPLVALFGLGMSLSVCLLWRGSDGGVV